METLLQYSSIIYKDILKPGSFKNLIGCDIVGKDDESKTEHSVKRIKRFKDEENEGRYKWCVIALDNEGNTRVFVNGTYKVIRY